MTCFLLLQVIREFWWDRGAYRPLREALQAMRKHANENGVTDITMGRLGAQDDGLDFRDILPDLQEVFYDSNITLSIYFRRT